MRKLLYAFGLTSALVFALAAHAAAPNFAGTWTLDKSKSQGLSQRMQNAESVSWVITQTDKEITVEEKVTGGGGPGGPIMPPRPPPPPPGGPPPPTSFSSTLISLSVCVMTREKLSAF